MKNLILVLALTGCGGESFTGFTSSDPATTDGGFEKIAAGGSGDDGGVLPTGTGGAAGAVGTATGGVPGSGGVTVETGGATTVGTGGSPGTGGTTGTGGVTVVTGGSPGTGGVTGTGGTTACTLITHDNGLGQTWQDCVPRGTYSKSQATKACEAWCAVNGGCTCDLVETFCKVVGTNYVATTVQIRPCGSTGCGFVTQETFWEWQGADVGEVGQATISFGGCAPVGTWD